MSLVTTPEDTTSQHANVQLTLTWPEAERLRIAVPWLLRALADRPELTPRLRERRHKAHMALEHLLSVLSDQGRTAEASE
jgi:hypothetical protein